MTGASDTKPIWPDRMPNVNVNAKIIDHPALNACPPQCTQVTSNKLNSFSVTVPWYVCHFQCSDEVRSVSRIFSLCSTSSTWQKPSLYKQVAGYRLQVASCNEISLNRALLYLMSCITLCFKKMPKKCFMLFDISPSEINFYAKNN